MTVSNLGIGVYPDEQVEFLRTELGMFSCLPFTSAQLKNLEENHRIYLLPIHSDNKRPQHNYYAHQYFVKTRLKMLIYTSKLCFFACFCLVLVVLATLCRGLNKHFNHESARINFADMTKNHAERIAEAFCVV